MRKSMLIGAGLAAAAILAVAGIASANATTTTVPPATATPQVTTTNAINQADAEQAALAAVPGSAVTETRLDTDNGRTVWNVHLSTPNSAVEVKVDAQTGAVRIDDGNDGSTAAPPTSTSDHHGGGSDDGSGYDAVDDHGRGSDDGPGHS